MKMDMRPELKVQLELDAHEKECAIRYQAVDDKLCTLDKKNVAIRSYVYGRYIRCGSFDCRNSD
jgi:hypothetical protein